MEKYDHALMALRMNACYIWFNSIQMFLIIGLLCLLRYDSIGVIQYLQMSVCFFMVLDIMFRYFSEGSQQFIKSFSNKIDLFIVVLAVSSLMAQIFCKDMIHQSQNALAGVVLLTRISMQAFRLFRLLMDSKKLYEIQNVESINLADYQKQEQITAQV